MIPTYLPTYFIVLGTRNNSFDRRVARLPDHQFPSLELNTGGGRHGKFEIRRMILSIPKHGGQDATWTQLCIVPTVGKVLMLHV